MKYIINPLSRTGYFSTITSNGVELSTIQNAMLFDTEVEALDYGENVAYPNGDAFIVEPFDPVTGFCVVGYRG